jgi:hypothetical protein
MAVLVKQTDDAEFVKAIKEALGLNADIIGVTIRSNPCDLITAEVVIPIELDQDRKVAEVLRRYRLIPIDDPGKSRIGERHDGPDR